jgi:D-arabinose 1-dehydrogenase-like Zn-dependent alcohol dehydrogenase
LVDASLLAARALISYGEEFFNLASKVPTHTETQLFRLEEASKALARLRDGRLQGTTVLSLCEK